MTRRVNTVIVLAGTWVLAGCSHYEPSQEYSRAPAAVEAPDETGQPTDAETGAEGAGSAGLVAGTDTPRPARIRRLPKFPDRFKWQTVTSEEGRYTVTMPGAPRDYSMGSGRAKVIGKEVQPIPGKVICQMSYSDVVPRELSAIGGPQAALERYCESQSRGSDRELRNKRSLVLDGYAGNEYTIVVRKPSGGIVYCHSRNYLVGTRLYCLDWIGLESSISSESVQAFFESFYFH